MSDEILYREYYLINNICLKYNNKGGIYLVNTLDSESDVFTLFKLKTTNIYVLNYYIYKICKDILDRITYYKLKYTIKELNKYILNLRWLKIITDNVDDYNIHEAEIDFFGLDYNYEYSYLSSLNIPISIYNICIRACLTTLSNNINLILNKLKE